MFNGIGKPIAEMSLEELRLAKETVKAYAKEWGWKETEYVQPRRDLKLIKRRIKELTKHSL